MKQIILSLISDLKFSDGCKVIESISDIQIRNDSASLVIFIGDRKIEEGYMAKKSIEDRVRVIAEININILIKKVKGPGVKNIILVSSGKGGVGKSTIAASLAHSLAKQNFKVGVLDADIYGPSMHIMLGVKDKKPNTQDKKIIPVMIEGYGIQIMSMGFLMNRDDGLAWRGPMLVKTLRQLLTQVLWSDRDFLIIDMPPGTGDIHLTILEDYLMDGDNIGKKEDKTYPFQGSGAVIVTCQSLISMADVERLINLYIKFGIKIHGIVENMVLEDFKHSAGEVLSSKHCIKLIDRIKFQKSIIEACDNGEDLSDLICIR
jgi:ATP-binding protein involved in chromosome partitioning